MHSGASGEERAMGQGTGEDGGPGGRGRVDRRDIHGGVGPWLTRTKSPGLIHFLNTFWTSCGVSSM